jgi:hypothetical protein
MRFSCWITKARIPLQKTTSGIHVTDRDNVCRRQTGAMVHPSQGVRHRADGCMTLGWWWQCHKQSPQGTWQNPIVFMPSTCKGLCRWCLLCPHYMWTHMKTSNKHKPLQCRDSVLHIHLNNIAQRGASNAGVSPQATGYLQQTMQKIEGKGLAKCETYPCQFI